MTHYRAARLQDSTPRADSPAVRAGFAAGLVAGAAVLTAVAAQASVTLPGSPIPFTLQPVAVLLAGVVLGARLGALSQALYLAAGVAGAAAFAWSPVLLPGAARLLGPTGGFLMAYPLAAGLVGFIASRSQTRGVLRTAGAMLAGLVVLYVGGVSWARLVAPAASAAGLAAAFGPYVAFDLVKVALVAPFVAPARRVLFGSRA
ncbi:MAG: biotin transporter BioY, partial [Acidobacteriota bacterium]